MNTPVARPLANALIHTPVDTASHLCDYEAGVVWQKQGGGKSFSMLFFAAGVVRHPSMKNPTLVVLMDRTDLDDQHFCQFQHCADILRQKPVQAIARVNRVFRDKQDGLVVRPSRNYRFLR